jgi:hypothetical protein
VKQQKDKDHHEHSKNSTELLPGFKPIWAPELKEKDLPPLEWLVDHLISAEGINAISSKPGLFKTFLAMEIAKCVANGEALFGVFATKQTSVLIIDQESGERRLKKRQAMLNAEDAKIAYAPYTNQKMSKKFAADIVRYCKAEDIGLVIFDSLTRFHEAKESSNEEMAKVLADFQLIAQADIAVLIIHHDSKGGYEQPSSSNTLRGASDILANLDVHLSISKVKNSQNKLLIKQLKNRDAEELPDFEVIVHSNDDNSSLWFEYVGEAPKPKSRDEITDEAIMAYINEHGYSSKEDIVAAFSGAAGQTKVALRLNELATTHELSLTTTAHGKKYFDLPKEPDNE